MRNDLAVLARLAAGLSFGLLVSLGGGVLVEELVEEGLALRVGEGGGSGGGWFMFRRVVLR